MSRSALAHSMRKHMAAAGGGPVNSDPLHLVDRLLESAPAPRDALALHGNARTLNIDGILVQHIAGSAYFRDVCVPLETVEALCEHVGGGAVRHLEPYQPGAAPRAPSPAFCALLRLGTLRPTARQVERMLSWPAGAHGGCGAFVRAVAALLLRYAAPPGELWAWLAAPAEDEARLVVAAGAGGGGAAGSATTVGAWVRGLLEAERHEGTLLPRVPAAAARDISAAVALLDKDKARAAANAAAAHRLVPGLALRARYSGDGEWYAAVVQRVEPSGRVVVAYPDFPGDAGEARGLGQLELPPDPRVLAAGGGGGPYGPAPPRGEWEGGAARGGERGDHRGGERGGRGREDGGGGGGGGGGRWGGRDAGRGGDWDRGGGSREERRGGGWDRGGSRGGGGGGWGDRDFDRGRGDRDGGGGGGDYHRRRSRSRSRDRDFDRGRGGGSGGVGAPALPAAPPPLPPAPPSLEEQQRINSLLSRYTGGGDAGAGGAAPRMPRGDEHRHAADVDGEEVLRLGGR